MIMEIFSPVRASTYPPAAPWPRRDDIDSPRGFVQALPYFFLSFFYLFLSLFFLRTPDDTSKRAVTQPLVVINYDRRVSSKRTLLFVS